MLYLGYNWSRGYLSKDHIPSRDKILDMCRQRVTGLLYEKDTNSYKISFSLEEDMVLDLKTVRSDKLKHLLESVGSIYNTPYLSRRISPKNFLQALLFAEDLYEEGRKHEAIINKMIDTFGNKSNLKD
jgi:hypothetical protein